MAVEKWRRARIVMNAVLDSCAGNLPAELSSFVGREHELHRLADLQLRHRLLTLAGPGGVGKTRLALRLGARVRDRYPDGVWLVDLAPLTDPRLVPQVIGDTLSVTELAGHPWLSRLTDRLAARRLLLILDSCEHLLSCCVEVASWLLDTCPEVSLMVTSRQPLELASERVWRVRPLSLPQPETANPQQIAESEAVRLFLARARARVPRIDLSDQELRIASEICRRVDGLPLGLELVAARVETLDLTDILTRLEHGRALRLRGSRAAPPRQQTLRATLDWSYALLTEAERALLPRLAVFATSWSMAAARQVCADAQVPSETIPDLLDRLVAKSLVIEERRSAGTRFRFLETVHDFARMKLHQTEEADVLQRRHAEYALELAELATPDSMNAAHTAVLEAEQDELRAALLWGLNHGETELALRLAIGSTTLWHVRAHYGEGRAWLESVLALPQSADPTLRADAECHLATLLTAQGDYDTADRWLRDALETYRARGDRLGVASALRQLGTNTMWRGDLARAHPLLVEAARALHELGAAGELGALFNAATTALELGQTSEALAAANELEAPDRPWPYLVGHAQAMLLRARVAALGGEVTLAEQALREALEIAQRLVYPRMTILVLTELGHVLLDQGKAAQAGSAFKEALEGARASGERVRIARAFEGFARLAAAGQPGAAVRLVAAAGSLRASLGAAPWPRDLWRSSLWLPDTRSAMDADVYDAAIVTGELLSLDEAAALAYELVGSVTAAVPASAPLTPRETEVALLVARGRSTTQIATELVISVATVRVHVEHILAKLGLHSRAEIARWLSQHEPPVLAASTRSTH